MPMTSTAAHHEVSDLRTNVDNIMADTAQVLAALVDTDAVSTDIRTARNRLAEAVRALTGCEAALAKAEADTAPAREGGQ